MIPVSQRGRESTLHGDAQPPDFIFITYATGMMVSLKQNTLYLTGINMLYEINALTKTFTFITKTFYLLSI